MSAGRGTTRFVLLDALFAALLAPLAALLLTSAAHGQGAPQRLSEWLLEQRPSPDAYTLGLSWRVPAEEAAQGRLRDELLAELAAEPRALALHDWIRTLPVTGRVPVALADARWLQVNPGRAPLLLPGHTVAVPTRPRTVTVITERGERCAVTHAEGREAMAYVEACGPASTRDADWVWIAQPDGRVQRFGVAAWNRERQDEPAPGAWIWGPSRASGFSDRLAGRLVRFLATQGPAADPPGGEIALPPAGASAFQVRSRSGTASASDWGTTGLLQTPSARMPGTGTLTVNFSHVWPYTNGNVFV